MCIICIANSKSTISCGSVDFFILVLVPAWLGTVSMGPVQSCGLTCLYTLYSLYSLYPLHACNCSSTKNWKPCCVWLSLVMKLLQNICCARDVTSPVIPTTATGQSGRQLCKVLCCVVCTLLSVSRHVLDKCYAVFGLHNVIMICASLHSCDINP